MAPKPETEESTAETKETVGTESPDTTEQVAGDGDGDGVDVQSPEFQSMSDTGGKQNQNEISRFADIKVVVSAELGRTSIPIERLLLLGSGSVLELDRAIDSPIELIAQGVALASGEVVVVDDCFAIRITEVYPRNRRGEELRAEKKD